MTKDHLSDSSIGTFELYLNRMVSIIHERNVQAGWWSDLLTGQRKERNVGEMIALKHSEVSEAVTGRPSAKELWALFDAIVTLIRYEHELKDNIVGMHSALSNGLEGHRKDLQDDKLPHRKMLEVEMADLFIRLADFCGGLDLDLGGAVVEKMEYNTHRADHKVENRRADGGKKI